ncbi:MAG: ATP-binding sensor histidine kinase [Waddliaceae bacterium]
MITIPNFTLTSTLRQTGNLCVFRGIRKGGEESVIIKAIVADHPPPLEIARLKHEYDITQALEGSYGVITSYELAPYGHQVALVMEDVKGIPLSHLIRSQTIDLATGLTIALKIAKSLQVIHLGHVIHKDVKPQNIIIQPETNEIKIIDFGLSTRLERERISVKAPEFIEGSLQYIPPEQTGRMNREITYRSDFYSLGVVLYEMFTGQLPFTSPNPLELIYFHIAKDPVPPHHINRNIPAAISSIILKLMAKNAEDRYKSASGLIFDLERCLQQLQEKGIIETFPLSQQDHYEHLFIPEKLYGREREIDLLFRTFEKTVQGQCQFVLVSGNAGIGKSVLIQEVQRPLSKIAGFFIAGKFDQFKRNIFYNALIEAFESLIRQILSESEETVAFWKRKILDALGPNGQLIIDVVPDVEAIIGKQLPLPELPPKETRDRFNYYFQAFIQTFISKQHPLILFLDDLQWIDLASLKLLKSLITDVTIKHLLVFGAYRSNEVPPDHPLALAIEEIDKTSHNVVNIQLQPLHRRHITQLLSDTFYQPEKNLEELAGIIKEKTEGNPFFIKELLKTLYLHKRIFFNAQTQQWEWDAESIRVIEATANVVELLGKAIQKSTPETQGLLKIASALGNVFSLKTLSEVTQQEQPKVANILRYPVEKGLTIPLGETYEFFAEYDEKIAKFYGYEDVELFFKFAHDRVQQAAYDLMSAQEKQEIHYEIGKRLLASTSKEEIEETIFDVVYHLNKALHIVKDPEEKLAYSRLNLLASTRSKNASSYQSAVSFAEVGLQWLSEEQKESEYALWYNLSISLAECLYHVGDVERSNQQFEQTLKKVQTVEEKIQILSLCNRLYQMKQEYHKAIDTGYQALALVGYPLPRKINKPVFFKELLHVRWFLYRYSVDAIRQLPEMTDHQQLLISELLYTLLPAAFFVDEPLFFVVSFRLTLMLKHGLSSFALMGLSVLGIIWPWATKQYEKSFNVGKLAIELSRKYENRPTNHFARFVLAAFLADRNYALKRCNKLLWEAYERALVLGDLLYAGYSLYYLCWQGVHSGVSLASLLEDVNKAYVFNERSKNLSSVELVRILRIYIFTLQGKSKTSTTLTNSDYNETEKWEIYKNERNDYAIVVLSLLKAYVFFLHKNYAEARIWLRRGIKRLTGRVHFQVYIHAIYLECLTLAGLYRQSERRAQKHYLKTMRKNVDILKDWAINRPKNKEHYYLLAKGEYLRLKYPDLDVLDTYLQGIEMAKKNGFIHDEAIGNELAGKYQLEKGRKEIAEAFFQEALWGYQEWGATTKVEQLKAAYPSMLLASAIGTAKRIEKGASEINLMEVMKTSQEISGELVPEKLLPQLIKSVVSTTGATQALLLLSREGGMSMIAEWDEEKQEAMVLPSLPLEENSGLLPQQVITYVEKVQEPLVLPSACQEGLFTKDPYIANKQIQSLLCLPLIHKGVLIGILYLENAAIKDAFRADRVEILRLLSSEIALAIDNATLYTNLTTSMQELEEYKNTLEQKVDARSIELTNKTEELENALKKLHAAQEQIIQQEKLSALGFFTQGVAHEIQNPLNFVNNFSELIVEQLEEIDQELLKQSENVDVEELETTLENVRQMSKRTFDNGIRIKNIVDLMLEHGQVKRGELALVNVNDLLHESSEIAYDDFLSKDRTFDILVEEVFDENLPEIEAIPQDLSRVFFNVIENAFYYAHQKKTAVDGDFTPTISLATKQGEGYVDIFIRDNGEGIPEDILDETLTQFFTTKPVGTGTGLGLSLSHDIIVHEHRGKLFINSSTEKKGSFTEVCIRLFTCFPKGEM